MKRAVMIVLLMFVVPTFASVVYAQAGDCDDDGSVNVADMTYLISYLFDNGPAPNLVKCDCDYHPGVDFADFFQLVDHLYIGQPTYPSPGTDLTIPSQAQFVVLGQPDGVTQTTATILVNTAWDWQGMVLAYSFHPGVTGADLQCTSIDFTGGVGTNMSSLIDNTAKKLLIYNNFAPALPSTPNWRLLCTANFSLAGPAGDPVYLQPITTNTISPMLLRYTSYTGINNIRVYYPDYVPFALMNVGNCDCKGIADIDDVVYLIDYIFNMGPPPGDPDGDGIPDC